MLNASTTSPMPATVRLQGNLWLLCDTCYDGRKTFTAASVSPRCVNVFAIFCSASSLQQRRENCDKKREK